MEVIRKICNKVAIMSNGEIVESGTTKQIFLSPKNELTKEFVAHLSHDTFRTEEEIKRRKENSNGGKLRLKLKYNEEQVSRSYIAELIRTFDVEVNILGGFIDKVSNIIIGNLLIEITANEKKVHEIIDWLTKHKIDSEVL